MRQSNWIAAWGGLVARWMPLPLAQNVLIQTDQTLHFNRLSSFRSNPPAVNLKRIGMVSGFMPLQSQITIQNAYGKTNNGPGVDTPISLPTKTLYPQLPKQMS